MVVLVAIVAITSVVDRCCDESGEIYWALIRFVVVADFGMEMATISERTMQVGSRVAIYHLQLQAGDKINS